VVEHFLGKEKATGSIPVDGSISSLIYKTFFACRDDGPTIGAVAAEQWFEAAFGIAAWVLRWN
jgi:hypothetical protein